MKKLSDYSYPEILNLSPDIIGSHFIQDLFKRSVRADILISSFSLSALRIGAEGLSQLVLNGGKVRWIIPPVLSKDELRAIVGPKRAISQDCHVQSVDQLKKLIISETLFALEMLVSKSVFEFRVLGHTSGEKHKKKLPLPEFAVFRDFVGNILSYRTSSSENKKGHEKPVSLKIYNSWHPIFGLLADEDAEKFDILWDGRNYEYSVCDPETASNNKLIRLRPNEKPFLNIKSEQPDLPVSGLFRSFGGKGVRPSFPDNTICPKFFEDVCIKWFSMGCNGILEMPPGACDVQTALGLAIKAFEVDERLALIVSVPYPHLVHRWEQEARKFGFRVLAASVEKGTWKGELKRSFKDFNSGLIDSFAVIVCNEIFFTNGFNEVVSSIDGPSMFLLDGGMHEVISLDASMIPENISFRLAKSSFPFRLAESSVKKRIKELFGDSLFPFDLKGSIGNSLRKFEYYPHFIFLDSNKFFKNQGYDGLTVPVECKKLLGRIMGDSGYIENAVFSCDKEYVNDMMHFAGWESGLTVIDISGGSDSLVDKENLKQTLEEFSSGSVQALVCSEYLEQCHDIPCVHTAFFLTSEIDPAAFFESRCRVLLSSGNEKTSIIHDLIVLSVDSLNNQENLENKIMSVLNVFAECAENSGEAMDAISALKSFDDVY